MAGSGEATALVLAMALALAWGLASTPELKSSG
jgi:hypothetical protein